MKLHHIAIIMDGNRRWASANNLPSYEGHKKGAENLWNVINNVQDFKIKFLTLFVFSTENWKRSKREISFLMSLLNQFLDQTISKINENSFRVRFIGDLSAFEKIWEFLFCWGPTPTPLNRFYSPHIRQGQAVFHP